MAQPQNNDRNKPHISRSSKKQKFQRMGRLIVFTGLLLSAGGGWIYLFNHSPKLLEIGLAIIGIGVLVTASTRFWDWWERGSD
jgi:di/tricarboxylate transporter